MEMERKPGSVVCWRRLLAGAAEMLSWKKMEYGSRASQGPVPIDVA